MSHSAAPYSPSHQYLLQRERNSKNYQQLVQNNAFTALTHPRSNSFETQHAQIRFGTVPAVGKGGWQEEKGVGRDQETAKNEPFVNPFRTFDTGSSKPPPGNQSHLSNYSITQIENESYSTLNLYNHSRREMEADQELTSSHATTKLNMEEEMASNKLKEEDKQALSSCSRREDRDQDVTRKIDKSQPDVELSVKPESQEYGQNVGGISQSGDGRKSHILVEEMPSNQNNSRSYNEQTVNQNHNYASYCPQRVPTNPDHATSQAYSIPSECKVQINQATIQFESKRTGRANSLNLKYSHLSSREEEQLTSLPKHLHSSNHTHFYVTSPKGYNFIHHNNHNHPNRFTRHAPKSQPKYQLSTSKNVRTDSLESKNKPVLEHPSHLKQTKSHLHITSLQVENEASKLQHSKMTKILKNDFTSDPLAYDANTSILYETQTANVCCGRADRKQNTVNRINFLPSSQRNQDIKSTDPSKTKGILSDPMASFDLTHISPYHQPKLPNYKINPLHMIKTLNENPQSLNTKKGIQLCGFNPTFLNKKREV